MKLNTYTIYDTASGAYSRPFFAKSDGEAQRSFQDIANDKEHPIGAHPEDYSLFRIGIFDDQNAKIISENPECLSTALEMVALAKNKPSAPTLPKIDSPGGTA